MSLLAWLTGTTDSASNTVEKSLSIIDEVFHTDQEKAEGKQKTLDWFLKYQEATKPQNIARRLIAIQVTALWMFLILLGVVTKYFEDDTTEESDSFSLFIFETLSENVNEPFAIIMGFYFLTHALKGLKNG